MQFAKEGEELSKKQLALESSTKKLRAQLKEAEQSCKDTETNLLIQRQQVRGAGAVGQLGTLPATPCSGGGY